MHKNPIKRPTCSRNVTNVDFSNIRKAGLNWTLEATFANYI